MNSIMRKIILPLICACVALSSCSLFKIDTFDAPDRTLEGSFFDPDGNLVTTDPALGSTIRLLELSYKKKHPTAVLSYGPYLSVKSDGTYKNSKLFKGTYEVYPYGAFMPYILKTADNDTVYNHCPIIDIVKKETKLDFEVQPFLYIEIDESSLSESNGQVTCDVYIRRGVSKEEFKEVISKAGNYSENFTNVKDLQLYVSYSPYVGVSDNIDKWSNYIEFAGDEFETSLKYGFDKPIKMVTKGNIAANRKVFLRAAARINYDIEGSKRYNLSNVVEWQF